MAWASLHLGEIGIPAAQGIQGCSCRRRPPRRDTEAVMSHIQKLWMSWSPSSLMMLPGSTRDSGAK